MPLTPTEKREYMRKVYHALRILGDRDPGTATPAVASLRLLLSDAIGEDAQRDAVGEWNDEARQMQGAGESVRELRGLAAGGIELEFVKAGMPLEWASRHSQLFQYMPPVHAALDSNKCQQHRTERRAAREWWKARDAGNMLLALAVLAADADAIRAHAAENLEILGEWRAAEPNLRREYEFEKHAWLRDHADEMAQWGRRVSHHLEMMAR